MNTQNYSTTKKRGRPRIDIDWPAEKFTVKDVIESMEMPPSNVLVHLKIKEGLQEGSIRQVGTKSVRVGRPQNVYQLVSAGEAPREDQKPEEQQNQKPEEQQNQKPEEQQEQEW